MVDAADHGRRRLRLRQACGGSGSGPRISPTNAIVTRRSAMTTPLRRGHHPAIGMTARPAAAVTGRARPARMDGGMSGCSPGTDGKGLPYAASQIFSAA